MDKIVNIAKGLKNSIGEFFDSFIENRTTKTKKEKEFSKPKKQKNYTETFCKNKRRCKCKSIIKIYENGEKIESSHSKFCNTTTKRETKRIEVVIENEEIIEEVSKKKTTKENDEEEEDGEFKIEYLTTNCKKRYLEQKEIRGDVLLSPKSMCEEKELKKLMKKKNNFSVPDFIHFQNALSDQNLKITIQDEIRKYRTQEEERAFNIILQESFKNLNATMLSWVKRETTKCLFIWNRIVGGITYKKIFHKNVFFVQVLLLAVDYNERKKGYGTKLLEYALNSYSKIVVYSDYKTQKFYQKLGFKTDICLFNQIKDKLLCEVNCIFMCYGFDDVIL